MCLSIQLLAVEVVVCVRETRQGAESDEESDGCDGAQDCNTTY
jgi:hypothetical protein